MSPWFIIGLMALVGSADIPLDPITRDGVTLRFIEAGEFRSGLVQGMEIDLVNDSDQPIKCDVGMALIRECADTDMKSTEAHGVTIPPHARQGFRVAEPREFGQRRIYFDVKVNGKPLANGHHTFSASGPYRLSVQPFFLSRNAVLARLEVLDPNIKKLSQNS